MKRYSAVVLCLLFVLTCARLASAASFSADAAYVLGKSGSTEMRGFLAGVEGEVYSNIFLEGRFLNVSPAKDEEGSTESLLYGALSYRVLQEADLDVLVGGGYTTFNIQLPAVDDNDGDLEADQPSSEKGDGFFGKLGVRFTPIPRLVVSGDVAYSPGLSFEDNDSRTLITGRVLLSYEVLEQVSVQGTVVRTSVGTANTLLYGGGITLQF